MYKNQLQELAQRSCFNLPSYTCIREGPDHAPRFKSTVNFNGEIFESPAFCTTLRQAEHSAAEVALSTLANRGPSRSLAARVLDETGAYKNLLQETVHRAGLNLPVYTTVRSGPGHVPVFTCHVELAGMSFTGEPAKTKKQAQKNAAMAAWSALKHMGSGSSSTSSSPSPSSEPESNEEQVIVARVLARISPPDANRSSLQNNRHPGRQRTIPISRNINPIGCGISMYPMPYPGLPYANFSSEVTMYQMWQQDQASQQQARLLTLPVGQVPQPGPHIIPFIHSIIQPDNMQYFPASVQESIGMVPGFTVSASRPPVCFSNHSMPFQISRSQVTIKEIQDERAQEKDKWVHEDADPDGRKVNIQSSPSMFSPTEVQNSPISGLSHAEQSIQGQPQDTTYGPRFVNPNPFCVGNPHGLDSSRANYRPHLLPTQSSLDTVKCYRPPLIAAPVMVRTVGPIPPVRPKPENMNVCVPAPVATRTATPCSSRTGPMSIGRASFMAPAVQIRSVVPVCSAPPSRKLPDLVQDQVLPDGEKRTRETKEVVTELSKLHI